MQDFITYTIVATASGYTLYCLVTLIIAAYKKKHSGCIGCAGGCEMKDASILVKSN